MMSPSHPLSTPSSSNLIVRPLRKYVYGGKSNGALKLVHKDDISREQLKELLYEEIMTFTPAI